MKLTLICGFLIFCQGLIAMGQEATIAPTFKTYQDVLAGFTTPYEEDEELEGDEKLEGDEAAPQDADPMEQEGVELGEKEEAPPIAPDVTAESVVADATIPDSAVNLCCPQTKLCACKNRCFCKNRGLFKNLGYSQSGCCGTTFNWGENTSLTVGAGLRTSYNTIEGGNPANGAQRQDFSVNNARLYFNGQGHERIGFEFNTDLNNAQGFDVSGAGGFGSLDEGEMRILDAIAKFQLTDTVHLWAGRMLPPSDRANLSGPFYQNAWNFPFVQFGYANIFQGRDDGAALWGDHGEGRFKWQVGAFEGESAGGPVFQGQPGVDNLMFAARAVVNLLDPEPGYYNSSTYYGEKNILAVGAAVMHRPDALENIAGTDTVNYTGWNIDGLFEKKTSNCGVVTLEGAYYNFDDNNGEYNGAAITNPPSFRPRQGSSYFLLGSYLFPKEYCILNTKGKFQAMGRFQHYNRDTIDAVAGGIDEAVDVQLNYIMSGHNARISAVWSQLDTPAAQDLDTFTLGCQLQF